MGLGAHAARRVGHGVDFVAFACRLDRRHRKADFRPQRRDDEFLAAGLFHPFHHARVLPRVDPGAVDRLLLGEDVLQSLDELAATVLQHGGQDGRHTENLGDLGERDDVVHDHRRLVAVQVGELERLVIDQDQDGIRRVEEGAKAVLEGGGLGHRICSMRFGVLVGVDLA